MGLINQTEQDYYNNEDYGGYQFTSLNHVIGNFMVSYVGEDKIISKIKRTDVAFHAQRALQELSFDTFKSCKSKEFEVPASLTTPLPIDYVNYTKLSWIDSSGIKHTIYPTSKTMFSPSPVQDSNGDFKYTVTATATNIITGTAAGGVSVLKIVGKKLDGLIGSYGASYQGTRIEHPLFPESTYVSLWWIHGDDTILLLMDGSVNKPDLIDYSVDNSIAFGDELNITFHQPAEMGDLHIENSTSVVSLGSSANDYILSNTVTGGESYITLDSASDGDKIKVGMLVHTASGASGLRYTKPITRVTGIVEDKVYIDEPLINSGTPRIVFTPNLRKDIKSTTWENYKSTTPSENNNDDYEDNTYWPNNGERYGLEPSHAQVNGSYFIDCNEGKIHFSSNISGKTVILEYISDSLGTDEEMKVHKFAEEAVYKWIAYAILSTRPNIPEYVIQRYKKERFAEIRKAKLRLSNIKLEEITQIFRGKSKQIKH